MRTILLLLAAATLAFSKKVEESTLRPGTEYIYKYESQVLNGIPGSGNQYAGLRLKCKVNIQFKHSNVAILKLEDVQLCEINADFKTLLPTEMQSGVPCLAVTEHSQLVHEELRKPISFKWEHGLVSHLESEGSDPYWSVNIKKGLLNLLHVSLSQETETRDLSAEQLEDYTSQNIISKDRSSDKVFAVREHDVMGKCETLYAIDAKLPDLTNVEAFKVTQIKDYRRCENMVLYEQGIFSGLGTWLGGPKETRRNLIRPVTSTNYELTGNRHNFLIQSAKMNSKYIFTPFTIEGGSFVTYMKQHFFLETAEPIRSFLTLGSHPVVHASALELHIPHSLATMSKELFAKKYYGKSEESAESTELSESTSDETSEEDFEITGTNSRKSWETRGKTTTYRGESKEYPRKYYSGERSYRKFRGEPIREKAGQFRTMEETNEESNENWSEYKTSEDTKKYRTNAYSKFTETEEDTEEVDESSTKIVAIKSLLKEIVASMHPFLTEETPTKIILLTRRLQYLRPSELYTLVLHYCSTSSDNSAYDISKIREILLDVLPVVPKPVVPKIIKKLAIKGAISPIRASYMLSLYALTAPPTPVALESLLSVCQHSELTSLDSQLMRTCWLGVGTLVRKLHVLHIKTRVPKSFSFAAFDEAIKSLKNLLTSSRDEKRMVALSAIGNAGLPDFIPELSRIVNDKSLSHIIREIAAGAFRRIAILSPGKSLKVLLPIVMNPRERFSLRIVALYVCLHAEPHTSTLELIAHRLRKDPSVEIKSFFYSYISTTSKADIPSRENMARKCKKIMVLMKPYDFGLAHSKAYYTDLFSEKINVGVNMMNLMVNSPNSFLPDGLFARLGAEFAHQPINLFEGVVGFQGLDEIVSNVIYAKGIWKKMVSGEFRLSEFLSSYEVPEFGVIRDTIKSIIEKVKITDRSYEKPELFALFRLFGHEMTFFNFDKKTITDLILKSEYLTSFYGSSFRSSLPINILKTLPLVDNCLIIPTPVGLPISINFTALAVANIHGSITPTEMPSLRDLFFSRSLPSEIKAVVDLKPSVAVKAILSMGVDMTVIKTSVAVKGLIVAHFPLKSEISIKPAESKLKITWEIPREQFTPLKATVKVVTVVKKYPIRSMPIVAISRVEKEVSQHLVLKTIPIEFPTTIPVLGLHTDVVGHFSYRKASWSPFHPLACSQRLEVICRPTEDRTQAVELKVAFDSMSKTPFVDLFNTYMGESSSESEDESSYSSKYSSYRASRSDNNEERDFAPVQPHSGISKPLTCRLSAILKTVGGNTERDLKALITWNRSPLYLVHHLNIQVVGSPIISHLNVPTKFMLDGMINIPEIFSPSSESLMAKLNISVGDRSYTDYDASIKVMSGSRGFSWASEYSPMYSFMSSRSASSAEKFEYYAVLKYNKIPKALFNFIATYHELVKVMTYPYLYVHKFDPTLSRQFTYENSGEITAYVKVIPDYKKISAVIKTPTESDIIIDLPSFNPFFARETLSIRVPSPVLMTEGFVDTSVEDSMKPHYSSWKSWSSECRVKESTVNTFDSVVYQLPETNSACEMVVARDCSSRGLFTIISSSLSRKVKILLPHYEIKISLEPTSYAYDVKVNGIAKEINRPILLSETPSSSSDIAYEITKEGDLVKVHCSKIGLTVHVGEYLTIKAPSTFRGRVCGLCGNFNGERHDEYEDASMTKYDESEYSSRSYTIPSDECRASDYSSKYSSSSSSSSFVHSDDCRTEMRNIAKTVFRHGERQVCITTKPEPVCSPTCRRLAVKSEHVAFHCLPANELSTEALIRESKVRVLHELKFKRIEMYDYIEVPEQCVAA